MFVSGWCVSEWNQQCLVMIAGFIAVCYVCIWMVYFRMEPAVFSYDCWFHCSLLCLYLDGVFQNGTSSV